MLLNMKNYLFIFLLSLSFILSVSAQDKKAELLDEFPTLGCEFLLMHADGYAQLLNENPNTKLYIIYYEGKHHKEIYNKKEKKSETVLVAPRRSEARNKTEAITLYLTKYRKISPDRFTLVDGGFDTEYHVQVWLVPNGVSPPKPSPFEKDVNIKFRKGKAPNVADCQGFYNDI